MALAAVENNPLVEHLALVEHRALADRADWLARQLVVQLAVLVVVRDRRLSVAVQRAELPVGQLMVVP